MTDTLSARFDQLMQTTAALQVGHFELASGLHSQRFFRCIKLFERPRDLAFFLDAFANRFTMPVDVVLGANEAGSILAFETARRLGARLAIARHVDQQYSLIKGFAFKPNQRVLIVDDITTTGGTAKKLLHIVEAAGAIPVAVGLLTTKGLFNVEFPCPVEVLIALQGMDAIAPADCPLCAQGVPLSR